MKTVAGICLRATEQPALRRQELYTGFCMERERMFVDAQESFATIKVCNSILIKSGEAANRVGRSHSSVDVL